MKEHGLRSIEEVDPLARLAMACPALPLCGLAQTEAERRMPSYIERMRAVLNKMNLQDEEILMRMTGCPNGCARPYMAELAFVGDGSDTYQIWLGGSPVLTRTAFPFVAKMKDEDLEKTIEPILAMFIQQRQQFEAFGDFCHRVGAEAIEAFSNASICTALVMGNFGPMVGPFRLHLGMSSLLSGSCIFSGTLLALLANEKKRNLHARPRRYFWRHYRVVLISSGVVFLGTDAAGFVLLSTNVGLETIAPAHSLSIAPWLFVGNCILGVVILNQVRALLSNVVLITVHHSFHNNNNNFLWSLPYS
jgi:sulfite reductase (ferredoxin)